MPVHVLHDCHVVVCVSEFPLPLSDRVLVVVVAAVVFRLHLEGRMSWDEDIDRERVDVVVDDKCLLGITNKHELDYNCI